MHEVWTVLSSRNAKQWWTLEMVVVFLTMPHATSFASRIRSGHGMSTVVSIKRSLSVPPDTYSEHINTSNIGIC